MSNTQPSSRNRISRAEHNKSCSAGLPVQASSYQTTLLLPAWPFNIEILHILTDSAAKCICRQFGELKVLLVVIFLS